MTYGRRSSRRQAVFILYQQDLLGIPVEAALERAAAGGVGEYAERLVHGVARELQRVDEVVRSHLTGWKLERLGTLERAILRVSTYELLVEDEVPKAVVIDQGVELAKRFCSEEAGALVNGVLGNVATMGRDPASDRRETE